MSARDSTVPTKTQAVHGQLRLRSQRREWLQIYWARDSILRKDLWENQ